MSASRLSEIESKQLTSLLSKCIPGSLTPEVFNALGRLVVFPAIELIPLRVTAGRIEVLLLRRDKDDPVWPSMLHMPGTVLRPTDQTLEYALRRLTVDELGVDRLAAVMPVGTYLNRNQRGNGIQIEYVVEVGGELKHGEYYDIEALPSEFIAEQFDSLERGAAKYRQMMKK